MMIGGLAMAQTAPQIRYSTHDWTVPLPASEVDSLLHEVWADVKTPGDGHVYAVGTVEVNRVDLAGTLFSDAEARPSPLLPPFNLQPGQIRQVVMLQASNAGSFQTAWQRFYTELLVRSSHAPRTRGASRSGLPRTRPTRAS